MKFATILLLCSHVIVSKAVPLDINSVDSKNNDDDSNEKNEVTSFVSRRLPNNSIPLRYDLWITTDIDQGKFDFDGRVKIHVKIVKASENITLNFYRSIVNKIDLLDDHKNVIVKDLSFKIETDLELLIVPLHRRYLAGEEIILDIQYNGLLRSLEVEHGFYPSSYIKDQKKVWYATTQFQMVEARQVMPCYDEPRFRAAINVEIQHNKQYNAISNMPIESRNPVEETDYVTSKFRDTLPMQTYLLAFVISDFKFISNNDTKVEQRIYANPASIDAGECDFALSVMGPMLQKFEEYFGIDYPMPKIDHAAIADFRYWAMENYGLFVYKERFMLHTANKRPGIEYESEEMIIEIAAHEFAHQYFGNLVSPMWWSYAWMNEGFATLFQFMIPDKLYPEKGFMKRFKSEVVDKALTKDTHDQPMTRYVETYEDILKNFNVVGNEKSASVLRMFLEAMTEKTFIKGLKYYLNAMKFSSATPEDLHRNLQRAFDEDFPNEKFDIGAAMHTWEDQASFPVVKVKKSDNGFVLTQTTKRHENQIFTIPISYATKSEPTFESNIPKIWMKSNQSIIESNDSWIIIDVGLTGHFLIEYDRDILKALALDIENNDIPKNFKIKILSEIEKVLYDFSGVHALKSLSFLQHEKDVNEWKKGITIIDFLESRLQGTQVFEKFQIAIDELTELQLNRLGFEPIKGEPEKDSNLRNFLMDLKCRMNSNSCLEHAMKELERNLEDPRKTTRLCDGLKLANLTVHLKVMMNYKITENSEITKFIGCSAYSEIIKFHLKFIKKNSRKISSTNQLLRPS